MEATTDIRIERREERFWPILEREHGPSIYLCSTESWGEVDGHCKRDFYRMTASGLIKYRFGRTGCVRTWNPTSVLKRACSGRSWLERLVLQIDNDFPWEDPQPARRASADAVDFALTDSSPPADMPQPLPYDPWRQISRASVTEDPIEAPEEDLPGMPSIIPRWPLLGEEETADA